MAFAKKVPSAMVHSTLAMYDLEFGILTYVMTGGTAVGIGRPLRASLRSVQVYLCMRTFLAYT